MEFWRSKTKHFCETSFKNEALKLKNGAFVRDFLQKWSFEDQKRSISARLPSKMKFWSSKTKLFCETSFTNEILKIKNEAFLRDFLQKWSFEAQKRSFSARLPSQMKFWRSKTKHFCETSFKNAALKLKNGAFVRDFLQKWSFEDQKRSFCARLPPKTKLWSSKTKHFCETSFKNEALKFKNEAILRDFLQKWSFEDQKTKHFCETSFKNDTLTGRLTSEFQYVLTIFKWMLQKYCACHEKVEPRHTKSCNCHAKWSLQNFRDMKFVTFPRILRRRPQPSTAQSTKSLRLPREKHHFGPSSNPPCLPTFLQPSRTPAPATHFETYRNPCACHAKSALNLKKWSETLVF